MGAWRILEKPGDIHIYINVAVTSEPWLRIPRDNEFRLLPVRLCNTLFGWSELWVRRNFGLGATGGTMGDYGHAIVIQVAFQVSFRLRFNLKRKSESRADDKL